MTDELPKGVMFNAYPDSIGRRLTDTVDMLSRPEFRDAFSLFYILPTFFNSDLDRGFSIIDYEMNSELVADRDLERLNTLNIGFKFDLVLNHLSVGSPQFQDMLRNGDASAYRDFFIDWNEFWKDKGEMGPDGYIIPEQDCLDVLFLRKPGLPILKVRFPDGSERPYWNTFYQEINYQELVPKDLEGIEGLSNGEAREIVQIANRAIRNKDPLADIDWGSHSAHATAVVEVIERNRRYLGQMDLNARSEQVWDYFDATLAKLSGYGAKLVRLDAFAYLHKEPCKPNFFNEPGTWEYLDRLKQLAAKYNLTLLPELHTEYGYGLHEKVADQDFPVYDFFFPGLVIDALDRATNRHLLRWIDDVLTKGIRTINMLGCHDGIPVLDLRGRDIGVSHAGLLSEQEIDAVIDRIIARGGRVKNLYGADGKKIAYYQVNAAFFSALGEDERKLRLARAIQMFMPGIPQVWYLDLFAGKNDYAAADKGNTGGHKEINRTTLSLVDIEQGLKRIVVQDQLQLIRLRNTSPAFDGELNVTGTEEHLMEMSWTNGTARASLKANLLELSFVVTHVDESGAETVLSYR
jgi:sucrose phosphorylase